MIEIWLLHEARDFFPAKPLFSSVEIMWFLFEIAYIRLLDKRPAPSLNVQFYMHLNTSRTNDVASEGSLNNEKKRR